MRNWVKLRLLKDPIFKSESEFDFKMSLLKDEYEISNATNLNENKSEDISVLNIPTNFHTFVITHLI